MPTIICIMGPPGTHKVELLDKIEKTTFERPVRCIRAPPTLMMEKPTFADINLLYAHYVEVGEMVDGVDDEEVVFIEGSPFDVSALLMVLEAKEEEEEENENISALNTLSYFISFNNKVFGTAIYVELKAELATIRFRSDLTEERAIKIRDIFADYYGTFFDTLEEAGAQVIYLNNDETLLNFVYFPLLTALGPSILMEQPPWLIDCFTKFLKFISMFN